jgi:hypothetical protein
VSIIGKLCGPVGSGVDVVVVLAAELQAHRTLNNTKNDTANNARKRLFITQE